MANPNPSPATRFKPGNTAGVGHRAPITGRLMRLIAEKGLDDTLAVLWLGAATGDENLLKGRRPSIAFFKELLDRIEGKVVEPVEVTATTSVSYERIDNDRDAGLDLDLDRNGPPDSLPPPPEAT